MKALRLMVIFLLPLFWSCDSDDSRTTEVPSVILNSFKMKFPEAVDVSWEELPDSHEVDFEIGRTDHSALLNASGEIVKLKQEISFEQVPAAVLSSLRKNFDPKDFEDPEKVLIGPKIYYQLDIDQFLLDEKVVLDENGRISSEVPYWD